MWGAVWAGKWNGDAQWACDGDTVYANRHVNGLTGGIGRRNMKNRRCEGKRGRRETCMNRYVTHTLKGYTIMDPIIDPIMDSLRVLVE